MPQILCAKFGSGRSKGAKVEKRDRMTHRHTNVYFNRIGNEGPCKYRKWGKCQLIRLRLKEFIQQRLKWWMNAEAHF